MADLRIEATKRDDEDYELTFKDVDGNVIDLTGATIYFTVKKNVDDVDADAVIKKEISSFENPESGVAVLALSKDETNIPVRGYYYDIQLVNASGKVSSTQIGRFVVKQDIGIDIS